MMGDVFVDMSALIVLLLAIHGCYLV